ncbi:MAG: PIG-L deacetylase family protein [Planctomycetota bacterium]
MLGWKLERRGSAPLRILCLGAHSDDIEIGVGGAILKLLAESRRVALRWVVFSASRERAREARRSAEAFLAGAHSMEIRVEAFRESYFPGELAPIKDCFEGLKQGFEPDLIFTHARDDRHQDHRVLSDLAWNTWRDHAILEYEIPKYDGDLGQPNFYFHLSRTLARRKADLIWRHFASQRPKQWFTKETLLSLMRIRGIESCAPDGYAEACTVRKAVMR